eukprot:TRINITY_DN3323_c0_g1_i1.p1 TRINITY_DN3323_c0_g1~~TRINITY_DN3323_c0_g1_i1.p1  ORF type:complete len:418 (-),score=140.05 TRINITY_DN3323_c0_g1_i1:40-1143(-)
MSQERRSFLQEMAQFDTVISKHLHGDVDIMLKITKGLNLTTKPVESYALMQGRAKIIEEAQFDPALEKEGSGEIRVTGPNSPRTDLFTELDRHKVYVSRRVNDLLPIRDFGHRFKSCAIVGSNPAIMKSENGGLIDSHQVVFRMNDAPAGGPNHMHSGNRTSIRLANKFIRVPEVPADSPFAEQIRGGKSDHEIKQLNYFSEMEIGVFQVELFSDWTAFPRTLDPKTRRIKSSKHEVLFSGLQKRRAWIASLDWQLHVHRTYRAMLSNSGLNTTALGESTHAFFPSLGFESLLLSLQFCDQVGAFGFGELETSLIEFLTQRDTHRENKDRYFVTQNRAGWAGHLFALERWLMEAIRLAVYPRVRFYV